MITPDDVKVGAKIRWIANGTDGIRGMQKGFEGVIEKILATQVDCFHGLVDFNEKETGVPHEPWWFRYSYIELVQKARTGYVRGDQGMFGQNRPKTVWELALEQEQEQLKKGK